MAYLLAAVGGALGALARWGVGTALPQAPGEWPWGTLLVNLTGCLLMGVLLAALTARSPEPAWARPLLGVGVLGGYTTYSAFAVEVVVLVEAGAPALAAAYVVVSLLGGLLAVAAGAVAVRESRTGARGR
ncbi:fluoride efflux transporter CrcB [Geodermatophilus sp. DSM 44513]|uniref:fluoride efflux transporter CrcB n=1 Tax=Geodermatophilus sp. DSM 44513 TaxID=1528104 RepID=UPI00127EAE2E|nr:fluoride efflux transporter CrcB [Geodermatophilus sp. DSM 44513]WNV75594.1 fluoride efflux transporter CrcB [Geodermatophilus sp. DSM 44513]